MPKHFIFITTFLIFISIISGIYATIVPIILNIFIFYIIFKNMLYVIYKCIGNLAFKLGFRIIKYFAIKQIALG
jgi:hypothetical protein